MELQINKDYRIVSDSSNFVLERRGISKDKKEIWSVIGYYGDLEWLYSGCIKNGLMVQDLSGPKEIIDYLKKIEKDIKVSLSLIKKGGCILNGK